MKNILQSASKLVFILLMLTACIAVMFEVITGKIIIEAKDFMVLAAGAASFYYSYKGSSSSSTGTEETTSTKTTTSKEEPFAGK